MNTELRVIHWKDLQGNKWSKSLHPAMLNPDGFRMTQKVRTTGESSYGGKYSVVVYDRKYVIGWLASKVIKPLSNEGIKGIVALIKEAFKNTGILPSFSEVNKKS